MRKNKYITVSGRGRPNIRLNTWYVMVCFFFHGVVVLHRAHFLCTHKCKCSPPPHTEWHINIVCDLFDVFIVVWIYLFCIHTFSVCAVIWHDLFDATRCRRSSVLTIYKNKLNGPRARKKDSYLSAAQRII